MNWTSYIVWGNMALGYAVLAFIAFCSWRRLRLQAKLPSADPDAERSAIIAARQEGFESGKDLGRNEARGELRALNQLRQSIADFKAESGVEISEYHGGNVGEAFAVAQQLLGYDGLTANLRRVKDNATKLRALADQAEQVAASLAEVLIEKAVRP